MLKPTATTETATGYQLMVRYCGRDFSEKEMRIIHALIADNPQQHRAALSRMVCEELGWFKADGGLKEMSARVAMLRMQTDGLIQLPKPRGKKHKQNIQFTPATEPDPAVQLPVSALPPLRLQMVDTTTTRLWNEYIHRYHYLGYTPLPGAQLRYFIIADDQILALISFSASAWQCAPRDQHIGWSQEQRKRNLHLIINNSRFLILPWVQSKNLASKTLAMAARKIADDWQYRYNYRPVLLETFVEKGRFKGTCYKAANWQLMGQTKGRGKLGPAGKISVPIKDIWLYPINSEYKNVLISTP